MTPGNSKRLPFSHVRITDFSWVIAGPLIGRVLGVLGAEVIKIETGLRVDMMRGMPPYPQGKKGIDVSGYFMNVNSDKLSVTLNLRRPEAREIAKRLVAVSDIVLENFTVGVMERYGLGYEELRRVRPDIIAMSMPIIGRTGPHAHHGGFGTSLQALAGLNAITGFPGRMPTGPGIVYPDFGVNPWHGATALLAALHYRNRTGRGQFIEIAQYESTVAITGAAVLDYTVNGRVQGQQGNRHPAYAPHNAYPCLAEASSSTAVSDRWCVIAVTSDEEWKALRRVMGDPAWAHDPRFATMPARKQNEDELDQRVAAWTRERTAGEVALQCQQAGVPAGVVQTAEDLLVRDPQMRAREHYVELDHPEAGKMPHDSLPYKLSRVGEPPRWPAPMLGQHNEYVFGEVLGLSEGDRDRLYAGGVFQ